MSEVVSDQKNKQQTPTVTVAMPVYNAGNYLRMAVLSIVRQTETNWELLIIDDGSTDHALDSIRDIIDYRIRIFQDGVNKGLAQRLNEAIDLARGQYFARMDQDDVSYPERFSRQVNALQSDAALDLLATRCIMIDESNQCAGTFPAAVDHKEICERPWRGFYFPHPTWMGKTEWFRKFHYSVPGPYLCEDQELLLRSYHESRFATVDEVLFAYRVRKRINWRKLIKTRKTVMDVQLNHFIKNHQWSYILMAIMVFVGRVLSDLVKLCVQVFSKKQPSGLSFNLAFNLVRQWTNVLAVVSDKQSDQAKPVVKISRT